MVYNISTHHIFIPLCKDLMLRAAGELPESGAGSTGHIFEASEEELNARRGALGTPNGPGKARGTWIYQLKMASFSGFSHEKW